jgi:hypothetical protein
LLRRQTRQWGRDNGKSAIVNCSVAIGQAILGYAKMRLLLAIIVIIYLIGVGVILSPIIRATWTSEPASVLAERVVQALPDAFAWPLRAFHNFAGS